AAEVEQAKARALAEKEKAAADAARDQADAERAKAVAARRQADIEKQKFEWEATARGVALTRSDGLRLGSEAMLARPTDPGLALLLGLEAIRRYPHPLTFSALFEAAADLHERRGIVTDFS